MNSPLAERAMLLFEQVFDLEDEARSAAVRHACGGDETLQREVELLLEHSSGIEIVDPEQASDDASLVFAPRSDGRYELLDEIGRGGMGIVYRAVDNQLNRTVAIKVMRPSTSGARALRRFSAEAQIAASLQHPGVAPVYDAGLLPDGRPFLAMKLVEGQTLSSLLSMRNDPAEDRALLLDAFENLCQVIAYAHSREVLHRDLKPDNVMVGEFGQVQVMDWGLAKSLVDNDAASATPEESPFQSPHSPTPASSDTRFGELMGTPAYMPPEQLLGQRGKQTDVFALGAILCEILTGHPPYTADSATEIIRKSAKADLDEADQRLDQCGADAELVRLARRCLLADPDERYADGAEVARRVSDHLQAAESRLRKAEMAKTRSDAKAIEEKKRRRVTALLMMTALLLVIVLLGGWGWISQREAQQTRQEALRRSAVVQQLSQANGESIRLYQAALDAPVDDLAVWESAKAAASQAKAMLPKTDIPIELADDISRLADQIAASASDRLLLSGIERARETSREQISVPDQPDSTLRQRRCEELQTAFESSPLNPDRSHEQAAREFLASRESSVCEALTGAIDEWIVASDSRNVRQWLSDALDGVDENSWRINARKAVLEGDLKFMQELLDSDQSLGQSPRSVLNLCWSIKAISPGVDTGKTLKRMIAEHHDDFWLNYALGDNHRISGQNYLAIQHYRAALGSRSIASLYRDLAQVELAVNQFTEARDHCQRALELGDRSRRSWESLAISSAGLKKMEEARVAYQHAMRLGGGKLKSATLYARFLDQTGRGSEAIEYLRKHQADSPETAQANADQLISLLCSEHRYMEAVEEYARFHKRRTPNKLLQLQVAEAAILAASDRGHNASLTNSQRNELRQNAHEWIRQVWVAWAARRTSKPVLSNIVDMRDSGSFDSVRLSDELKKLPFEQQMLWSDLWTDIRYEESRSISIDSDLAKWTVITPTSVSSTSGATFIPQQDGSLIASGPNELLEIYTITSQVALEGINAIRLDVIADERLPNKGPGRHHRNGLFQVAEIEMQIPDASSEEGTRKLSFERVQATHRSKRHANTVDRAIDGDQHTVWDNYRVFGVSQTARFYLEEPIPSGSGQTMVIRIVHGGNLPPSSIGRFRLSFQRAPQEVSP